VLAAVTTLAAEHSGSAGQFLATDPNNLRTPPRQFAGALFIAKTSSNVARPRYQKPSPRRGKNAVTLEEADVRLRYPQFHSDGTAQSRGCPPCGTYVHGNSTPPKFPIDVKSSPPGANETFLMLAAFVPPAVKSAPSTPLKDNRSLPLALSSDSDGISAAFLHAQRSLYHRFRQAHSARKLSN